MTNSGGPGSFFNLSDISVVGTDMFLPVETENSAWLIFASIFAIISLADLLLNLLRQRSMAKDDVETLAAIGIATLPHHDQSSMIIDDDRPDAWFPGAHTDPSMGIRRRISHQQEGQDETSIEDLGIATLPHHHQSSAIIDDDRPDLWFPGAHSDPPMGIRRRIRHQQEGQDETSIEDQSVREEDLPYSMARYLNQPLRHGAIGEMPFLS